MNRSPEETDVFQNVALSKIASTCKELRHLKDLRLSPGVACVKRRSQLGSAL